MSQGVVEVVLELLGEFLSTLWFFFLFVYGIVLLEELVE